MVILHIITVIRKKFNYYLKKYFRDMGIENLSKKEINIKNHLMKLNYIQPE